MNRDTVTCFWCEPSDRAEESLRRFVFSTDAKCTGGYGYHTADVVIAESSLPLDASASSRDDFDHSDPRWPTHCSCGYAFQPGDEWQHNVNRKWRRADGGALYTLHDLPPGAMYNAEWYGGHQPGPDGIHLIVVGPAKCGSWYVDGGAKGGGGWTRTGDPRRPETLSCSPSIWWGQSSGGDREWHGFLTNGVLRPC